MTMSSSDTAFRTGVEPCFSLSNIVMVSGESEPTSISVVLKFSKLISTATMAAATIAGNKNGSVKPNAIQQQLCSIPK